MTDLFLKIVNMSISAAWLVLAVLALRLLLKKAPKWTRVLLWGLVAVRLVCPFSVESVLSLIPSRETISPTIVTSPTPSVSTGIPALNQVVNPVISQTFVPVPGDSTNPLQIWLPVLAGIWVLGMALMFLYAAVSYGRLRGRVKEAVLLRDRIYLSEYAASAFVLGIIKPRIYLSYGLSGQDAAYVIAHEQAHIRRKDHWWKPLGFLLLAVHWFNPILWVAYVLLCRDIELACDEKVIGSLKTAQRADYSQALLSCSVSRRTIAACPLAFGEVGVKERVRSVLNYRKPAFWAVAAAVVLCAAAAVCFLTDPKEETNTIASLTPLEDLPASYSLEQAKQDGCVVMENGDVTSGQEIWYSFADAAMSGKAASVRYVDYYTLDPHSCTAEYYEKYKDGYPLMCVFDLFFDGTSYTCREYENGEETVWTFRYLMRYTGEPDTQSASFRSYEYYVLTDDDQVTWDDIFNGMASSRLGDYIPHLTVYSDYIYRSDPTLSELEQAQTALEPYMLQFGIATLDANERTMTLDIQIREEVDGLETLVAQFIDLKFVRIGKLEGELVLVKSSGDRLAEGVYVAESAYTNPLSSYILTPGDITYRVTEDSLITYQKSGGSSTIKVNWHWTDGTWWNPGPKFLKGTAFEFLRSANSRYQKLEDGLYIIEYQQKLYLVRQGDSRSDLTAIWSVYILVPEAEFDQ